MKNSVDKCME